MKIFDAIDQSRRGSTGRITLRETILVVLASPAGGTPVMDAAPLSALDLPLKVLIWSDRGTDKGVLCFTRRPGDTPSSKP